MPHGRWGESVAAYIDDAIVFSPGSFDAHFTALRTFYTRIRAAGLHIKPSKCRDSVIARTVSNETYKKLVRDGKATRKSLKRQAKQPRAGRIIKAKKCPDVQQLYQVPYAIII